MAVITISRQFGSGGWSLAKRLCERFGFELITEEVIDSLARKEKVSPDWLRAVEKEACSKLLSAISSVAATGLFYRSPAAEGQGDERKRYIDFLTRVMGAMADRGGYVLVGRGAQFILRGHPKAVHVMLAGEYEDRVQFLIKTYRISRSEAEDSIKEKERQRASVASRIFETEVNDPKLYHVTLNTSLVPFEWAVETVADLVSKYLAKEGS
jgi:cytidylate kinase